MGKGLPFIQWQFSGFLHPTHTAIGVFLQENYLAVTKSRFRLVTGI